MTRRALEICAFAALAWYAAAHWANALVASAPSGRVFACVVIASAVGVALTVTQGTPGVWMPILRGACVLAGLGAGFVAVGLERALLAPGRWDDLADGLDRGLAGLGSVEWPYDGPEPWAALTLLLAIPLVVVIAAGFAFWGGRGTRPVGLVLLVMLYGTAVVEHQFSGELARGLALFLLVAAWLWLPALPARGWMTAAVAGAAVMLAAVAALPVAARYQYREAWIDYESWNPFAVQASTRFDWTHSYGPLDWPRDGTTLMNVRAGQRHYWKVQTLDRFDGFRWVRSGAGRGNSPLLPRPYRGNWETNIRVTIRELDTTLFPIAGTAIAIQGADPVVVPSEDGTVEAVGEALDEGDSYTVQAYVPDPTPAQLRDEHPVDRGIRIPPLPGELEPYTEISLPPPGTTALDGAGRAGDAARSAVPFGAPATAREILGSPYGRVLRLARRLADGQPTTYDTVRAIQRHLRSEYRYSERPPSQEFPLAAFLFEDRVGYCQQFSGAMALMLRMLDIPSRVAAGFTPGSYNADTGEYRVRDLDAHSWVEVWFAGVGWVPFDPTPSVAPAGSQSSADAVSASGGDGGAGETPDRRAGLSGTALSERAGDPGAPSGPEDPVIESWTVAVALLLLALVAAGAVQARRIVRERRDPAPAEEREVRDLRRALAGVGEPVAARMTLRQVEERIARAGGPSAARYVRILRERRYGPGGGRPPDAAARRDLRRALVRGRGPRARLAALSALPPISFRRG